MTLIKTTNKMIRFNKIKNKIHKTRNKLVKIKLQIMIISYNKKIKIQKNRLKNLMLIKNKIRFKKQNSKVGKKIIKLKVIIWLNKEIKETKIDIKVNIKSNKAKNRFKKKNSKNQNKNHTKEINTNIIDQSQELKIKQDTKNKKRLIIKKIINDL